MSEPSDYERMAKIIASTPSPKAEQPSSKESFSWPTSKGDPIGPVWSYAGKKGMYQAEALRAFAHDLVDRIKEFELPVREAMKAAGGDGLDAFAYCRMLQRRLEGKEREIERLQRENANLLKRNIILSASPEPTAPASNTSLARINRLWLECCEKIGAGHGFEQYTALKNAARDEIERLQLQNAKLLSALNAKQAKIDALMLEFCPGEMSAEQLAEYGRAQRVADEPEACEHGAHPPTNCAICVSQPPRDNYGRVEPPYGYAYRYHSICGGTVISFDRMPEREPIEVIPYWLGKPVPELPAPPPEALPSQADVLRWAVESFGPIAQNVDERAARVAEEAIEIAQVEGVPLETIKRITDRIYSRPPGERWQEIGGTMIGMLSYAEIVGLSLAECTHREFQRVLSKPRDWWQRKHAEKVAAGTADLSPVPTKSGDAP